MQGSGPEGVDDLCFHTYEEFSPHPSPPPGSWGGWPNLAEIGRIWQNLAEFARISQNLASWGGTEKEEKEKEEKIPHTCESIGHRPLRGRCPKGSFAANKNLDRKQI